MVVSKHITGPPALNADLLSVMHDRMRADDQILSTLRSGQAASLTVRYYLGRKRHGAMRPPTVTEPVRSAEERPDPSESSRDGNGRARHAGAVGLARIEKAAHAPSSPSVSVSTGS
jgi:hypothetical protein